MKKNLFLLLALLWAGLSFGQSSEDIYTKSSDDKTKLVVTDDYTVNSSTDVSKGLITIGTGTLTTLGLPIDPYMGYSYSQCIYLQTEIAQAENITKVYFYFNGGGSDADSKDWVIYMGHTSKTAFSSTTDWVPSASLTEVFNGVVNLTTTAGWIEITLATPFAYNNTDNLVIAVDENSPSWGTTSQDFYGTSFPSNRSILYTSDSTNPNPATPPTGVLKAGIANVQLMLGTPPALDASITAITSPVTGITGTQDVIVTLKNLGTTTMTACDINYNIGGTTGTHNWSGSLANGASEAVTVYPSFDFNLAANYTIIATATLTGDEDESNNEFIKNVTIFEPYTVPVFEGFETGQTDAVAIGIPLSQVSVAGTQVWTANSSQTTYNRTPRTGTFNSTLYYSNTDWLFLPVYLESGKDYDFSVWARQDGATAANASIKLAYGIENNAAAMINEIVASTGIISGNYQEISGVFSVTADGTYYLGILGTINGTPYYISIDDITVEEVLLVDAELLSISAPGSLIQPATSDVSVVLQNNGLNNLTACDINYTINGTKATFNWTGDLAMGANEPVTIATGVDFTTVGFYLIEANVVATDDEDPSNDAVEKNVEVYEPTVIGALIYNNGPIVNSPGTGLDGADESVLQSTTLGMTALGAGQQLAAGNRVADEIVIPAGERWVINGFASWAYQTGSTLTSTMNAMNLRIWEGDPLNGGTIMYDYSAENLLTGTDWDSIYRVTETTLGNTTRPVMKDTAFVPEKILEAGEFWFDWQKGGTLASGPWIAPITIAGVDTTGNARQFTIAGGWVEYKDGATNTPPQGFPFELFGKVQYLVTYEVLNGNGTLSADTAGTVFDSNNYIDAGADVLFSASPDAGYAVKEIYVNSVLVTPTTDVTYLLENLSEPVHVTVEFWQVPTAGDLVYKLVGNPEQTVPPVNDEYDMGDLSGCETLDVLVINISDDNIDPATQFDVFKNGETSGARFGYLQYYSGTMYAFHPEVSPFDWLTGANYLTSTVSDLDGNSVDMVVNMNYIPCAEKAILTYSLAEQTGPAVINVDSHTITVEVAEGTEVNGLTATFTVSPFAEATVETLAQESGVTPNDFTDPVTYVVTAQDLSTQDWLVTVTIATGVNNLSNANVKVYPNPANGMFFVSGANESLISVRDLSGRVILREKALSNNHQVDLSSTTKGIYFVQINNTIYRIVNE